MHQVVDTLHNLLRGRCIQTGADLIHEEGSLGADDHLACCQPAGHWLHASVSLPVV